jgi:hypothetical protein
VAVGGEPGGEYGRCGGESEERERPGRVRGIGGEVAPPPAQAPSVGGGQHQVAADRQASKAAERVAAPAAPTAADTMPVAITRAK